MGAHDLDGSVSIHAGWSQGTILTNGASDAQVL